MAGKKGERKSPAKTPVKSAKEKPAPSKSKSISFYFHAPDARSVTIAGSFNNWDGQANPLTRNPEGTWTVTLSLKPGSYHYKFVINGDQWQEDPGNPNRLPNDQGDFNSVCEVS